jgi:predicted small integral membrane protein
MTFGDRLFWGIMTLIGVVLLWLGVLPGEAPAWIGITLGAMGGLALVLFGPRPRIEQFEEQEL